MLKVEGAAFIKGNALDEKTKLQIAEFLNLRQVDVILSDMAPNLSGEKDIDTYEMT